MHLQGRGATTTRTNDPERRQRQGTAHAAVVVTVHCGATEGGGRGAADLQRIVSGDGPQTLAGPRGVAGAEGGREDAQTGGGESEVAPRECRGADLGHANGSSAICGGFTEEHSAEHGGEWESGKQKTEIESI